MSDHPQRPLQHLRETAREYLTHWAVAGVIVTTTGFAPDHWFAHLLEGIPAGFRQAFPSGVDYRLIIVCLGISVIALDIFFRNRRRSRIESSGTVSTDIAPQSRLESLPATSAAIDLRSVAIDPLAPPDKPSIAVLPFANLSNDPEQAYFAEGLTASLTTDLSRVSDLFVIASTTSATFDGKTVDTRQVGRELGVRYVLQGSVQRGGEKVRMNAQLVDAGTGVQLWSDRFDGDQTDLFALQDQITGRIANSIGRAFVAMAARDAEKRKTSPRAADLLIRGIALADKPATLENLQEQEVLFRGVLALEPNHVDAWARLGRALLVPQLYFSDALSPDQMKKQLKEGREAVEKALALDPNNARAHLTEAMLHRVLGNPAEDARAVEVAIALDNNSAYAHGLLGTARISLGEPEKAIPCLEQAMRLDPLGPQIAFHQANMGKAYFVQGHSDLAIEWLLKARASNPKLARHHAFLAASYAQKGDAAAARLVVENLLRMAPGFRLSQTPEAPQPSSPEAYRRLYEQVILPAARKAGIPE